MDRPNLQTPTSNSEDASASFVDRTTTLEALKRSIAQFAAERDWGAFHTPKNLAVSVAIEAAELMEHFQWLTPEESLAAKDDPEKKRAIAEEISDVLSYLLNLCNVLEIDVAAAFEQKTRKNALKYPVEKFRGVYGYDDPALNRNENAASEKYSEND